MASSSSVIAAFACEISKFLQHEDRNCFKKASRLLLSVSSDRLRSLDRAQRIVSFVQDWPNLVKGLRTVLSGEAAGSDVAPKNKRKHARNRLQRLNDQQLAVLVRDLVLVGLGIRASCLVDSCRLECDTVAALVDAFAVDEKWRQYGLHCLSSVRLADNLFFVNTGEFVRLKCLDFVTNLHSTVLIDANADLTSPQFLNRSDAAHQQLVLAAKDLVLHLTAQPTSALFRRSIDLGLKSGCPTARAGLILCYPVIYHVDRQSGEEGNDDPFWSSSPNCLGLCPLHLFQVSLSIGDSLNTERLALAEFSAPEHLIATASRRNPNSTTRTIINQCRRSLQAIVRESELVRIEVQVSLRTLPHVAL